MIITFCPSTPSEPFIPDPPVSPWKFISEYVNSVSVRVSPQFQ